MVMEASPSPQSVGREFVRQYYTLLNKAPAHLHRFYNNLSSFVHGGLEAPTRETLPVVGQKQIHNRIQQLNFRDCHAKISQVDAQATLGNGVVVQVTGELSNDGAPMRRFTQTFVLAAQSPKKYYVHNDIFRYQDIVFSDEEGSGSGRSEGEGDEEVGGGAGAGYFPGFPAPPPPPAAPMLPSAPLPDPPAHPAHPAHLNGHPQHQDATAPAPAPAPAPTAVPPAPPAAVCTEPEPEAEPEPGAERAPSPEPEREPTPTPTLTTPPPPAPHHPVVVAPPEPKTYANLLKSGGGAPRPAPPAPQPAPPAAPPAPLAPQDQRARPTRAQPPSNNSGESRERGERGERERESREREREGRGEGRGGGGGARYSDAQQLFLGNLPHSATEEELRALFARFGPVAELRVHTKQAAPGAPRHPNYGFITYETSAAAHDCLGAAPLYFPADGADGVKLNVEEKKQRGREPPRRRPPSGHRAPAPAFPRPAFRR